MSDISEQAVEDVLTHYGKKGMKWGIRGSRAVGDVVLERGFAIGTRGSRARAHTRAVNRASAPVKVTNKGKKLKTSGGKGHSAHPDAVRAYTLKQVSKKSGVKALSNDDLQSLTKRLQLESSLRQLNSNNRSPGTKFANNILKQSGNKVVQEITGGATSQVKKQFMKRIGR